MTLLYYWIWKTFDELRPEADNLEPGNRCVSLPNGEGCDLHPNWILTEQPTMMPSPESTMWLSMEPTKYQPTMDQY